jgi:Tat protein translocase TatB subunit
MFGSIGFPELLLILVVALLVFGPKKLPEIAKMLGKTLHDFRKTINDAKATIQEEIDKADITKDLKEMDNDIKEITATGFEDEQKKTK